VKSLKEKSKIVKSTLLALFASAAAACAQDWCWQNFAGSLTASGDVDDTGAAARFSSIYGIDINGAENLLVVMDRGAGKIKTVTIPGGVVTSVQGPGLDLLECAINIVNGNLYYPDTGTTIRKLAAPYTGSPTTIANIAAFSAAVDSASDTVYIPDRANNQIYYLPSGGSPILLAGSGTPGLVDGTLAEAQFRFPMGMAVVVSGGNTNIYLVERDNHAIRHIDVAANSVTLVAGGSQGTADGTGAAAQFSQPHNVVMGPDGNLYVCDQDNDTVRKVTLPGGVVTTIMGVNQNASGTGGATEGCGAAARNGNLGQITIDSAGHIYTGDRAQPSGSFAHIMKGTPPGSTTVVQIGFTGGGSDTASSFTLQSSGNVTPASGYGNVSATITGPTGGPFQATIAPSGPRQFYRIKHN